MSVEFELNAEPRDDLGKGASRRLRRQGRVPAVMYGAGGDVRALSLHHNEVMHQLQNDAFYSHILNVKIGSQEERAILRDLQRHPFKPAILHMDLQRVTAHEKLRMRVPLHFLNEESARGVKEEGGVISHLMIDLEVTCLPKDLPESIEVDVADLGLGDSIHLSELKLPEGVEIPELVHGPEHDLAVVNVHHRRIETEEEEEEAAEIEAEGAAAADDEELPDADKG